MPYTLTLTFTPSVPPSPFGYRITYWPVSNPLATTSVIVPSSPYTITGLTQEAYAGTVETQCELGVFTNPVEWSAEYTVPESATLSFDYYSVINCDNPPPTSTFQFNLSPAILEDITITYAYVVGYASSPCDGSSMLIETDEIATSVTIPSGSNGATINGDNPICCSTVTGEAYIHFGPYIQVSGVPGLLTNGSTFTTPLGTTVTVSILDNCEPLDCPPPAQGKVLQLPFCEGSHPITDILFNGQSVTFTSPSTIEIYNPGTGTLVFKTGDLSIHSVTLTDSNGTTTCVGTTSPFTFTGVYIDNVTDITIKYACVYC